MSYDLPQATKTRKIQSLSGDQRKIAEELIAEKFDVKEEVVESRDSASFRQEYGFMPGPEVIFQSTPSGPNGFYDVLNESHDGPFGGSSSYTRHRADEVRTRVDFYTRRRVSTVAIQRCSTRGIMDALSRLDMENLPRSNRVIRLGRGFWMEFRRDEDVARYMAYRDSGRGYGHDNGEYIGHMFGCPIFVAEGIMSEVEVSY